MDSDLAAGGPRQERVGTPARACCLPAEVRLFLAGWARGDEALRAAMESALAGAGVREAARRTGLARSVVGRHASRARAELAALLRSGPEPVREALRAARTSMQRQFSSAAGRQCGSAEEGHGVTQSRSHAVEEQHAATAAFHP